jgi:hypothetical protein
MLKDIKRIRFGEILVGSKYNINCCKFTLIISKKFNSLNSRLFSILIFMVRLLSVFIWQELELILKLALNVYTSTFRFNLILTAGENDRVENRTPADDWPKSLE